ncbi:hypothetical protein D7V91_11505 [bacterium 1xD42-67]|nr:hypothetical protein D7V91_11505 [bacterium 1xD42-67]
MIPKITQSRPNILERYWCGKCNASLPGPHSANIEKQGVEWKYCPICGEPIEYDKAKPVQWAEQDCEHCGRWLIKEMQSTPRSYFMASSDYVGAQLCRACMEEHCAQTNCLQCEVGQLPDCPYAWIKKSVLEHNNDTE